MKKKLLALLLGVSMVFLMTACGGSDDNASSDNTGGDTTNLNGEQLVKNKGCVACHGQNLEGMGDAFPSLKDVGSRLSKDEIKDVILNGKGSMQPQPVSDEEADAMAEWLASQK